MTFQQRYSDPVELQRVWKAIEFIRGQRQIANIARITKVIQREHTCKPTEIMQQIFRAVKDNTVIETLSMGCKGSKAGLEQEGYWVPEECEILKLQGTHDSYCFNCHKPGKVMKCNACSKAYHIACMENCYETEDNWKSENFLCKFCVKRKEALPLTQEQQKDLNKCLGFIVQRSTEFVPDFLLEPKPEEYMYFKYFVKEHKTLHDIAESCRQQNFDSIDDMLSQIQIILHNCSILHGEDADLTEKAKKIYNACKRELNELALCPNCYLLSSTKPNKDWFCAPCNPPHKVVWAKQKGFEYWPAKVIQIDGEKLDVRFFGGHHERAWVKLHCVKSILTSPSDLHIRKTKGWTKASDEMKKYITEVESNLGKVHAKNIVEFDPAVCSDSQQHDASSTEKQNLVVRCRKRKAEMHDLLSQGKKQKVVVKTSESSYSGESQTPHSKPKHTLAQYLINQSSKQVKAFGQKAKLNHECARTWPYATDCILINRDEAKQSKRQNFRASLKNKSENCNCHRIYSRKLFLYKSTVRKLRMKEKRDNLMISALYIRRHLSNYAAKYSALQEENAKLKSENEHLRSKLSSQQSEQENNAS